MYGRGERLLSTVLGGLLTVYGLKRRGRAGYGMALIGAEMLYRGTTGHCHAYSAMGISTENHNAKYPNVTREASTVNAVSHVALGTMGPISRCLSRVASHGMHTSPRAQRSSRRS